MDEFFVMNWDFNRDCMEYLEIISFFVSEYKELSPSKRPKTESEFRKFVDNEAKYQFWSRCEYEFIAHGWPVKRKEEKIDVYYQIKMNIDLITKLVMKNV